MRARASFSQERMWFIEALDPESAVYNLMSCYVIKGSLDPELLKKSLGEVIVRHEALRTNVSVVDGEVYQSVSDPLPPGLKLFETGEPEEIRNILLEEARRPFDLSSEPLIRPYLFRLAPDEHILAFVVHHLIIDGWSLGLLLKEIVSIYEEMAKGSYSPSSLPPVQVQYREYSSRQREAFESGTFDAQLEYWQRQLSGELPVLQMPFDHPRPRMQSYKGRAIIRVLPTELAASLKALGRGEKATLYMVLLSALYALLYRYSGQDDIVVGSPVAGRNQCDIEGMIGLCINTLALRCAIRPEMTFVDLLRQVRKVTLDAYDNQDVPFEKLVERLSLHRSLDVPPVFQLLFQLRNFPTMTSKIGGFTVEKHELEDILAKVDLTLEVTETKDGLSCRFEYPVALFEEETIGRMARHWQNILEDIVRDPGKKVSRIGMLDEAELSLLRKFWKGSVSWYPETSISKTFEDIVDKYPDLIALKHGDETVTYRALDARASALAARLRESGIKDGKPVLISMERSAGFIISMLATVKAGGAYVPIDPAEPDGRLRGILADVGATIAITRKGEAERFRGLVDSVIAIDDVPLAAGRRFEAGAGPDSIAYIMYTSGSTGMPKGVCIPHRGILRLVLNTDYVAIKPGDKVAHMSNPAFDAATFEVWGALLNGATIAVIDKDTALSPPSLKGYIEKEGIDVMFITTPLFNMIVKEDPASFKGVRDLFVGGETMDPGAVSLALKNGPPVRLYNVYGPTENTTFSSYYPVTEPVPANVPIGRPIANSRIYVLDGELQPAPVGIPGEIYHAGDGLSAGYLSRPELNARAFLPDIVTPGMTMYRSGDRGRFLADGNVEFLGRGDGQVKVRGFRVETGEIVAAIESLPGIKKAVVKAYDGPGGVKSLAAYAVRSWEQDIDVRRSLASKLPPHMIPASFTWIESVPLTPRGKVDYDALPVPESGAAGPAEDIHHDERLGVMLGIWKEVLGVNAVRPDDDFFGAGGHSLLAIRLISRIEDAFKVRLPVSAVYKTPTPRLMAEAVMEGADKGNGVVTLRKGGDKPPLFCIHGVPGTLFEYYWTVHYLDGSRTVYGIQSAGLEGGEIRRESLRDMAVRYADEIRKVQPHGPYSLLSYCAAATFAFETACRLESLGEKVAFVGVIDYLAPKREVKSLGRTLRRFAIDNAGGASEHLKGFLRAGSREKAKSLMRLPGFMARKTARLPRELSRRASLTPAGTRVEPVPHVYSEWILALPEPHRSVCMANQDAVDAYHPERFGGRVTLFISSEKVDIYRRYREYDPEFGWQLLAAGGVDVHVIEGSHTSVLEGTQAMEVARHIDESLSRVRGS